MPRPIVIEIAKSDQHRHTQSMRDAREAIPDLRWWMQDTSPRRYLRRRSAISAIEAKNVPANHQPSSRSRWTALAAVPAMRALVRKRNTATINPHRRCSHAHVHQLVSAELGGSPPGLVNSMSMPALIYSMTASSASSDDEDDTSRHLLPPSEPKVEEHMAEMAKQIVLDAVAAAIDAAVARAAKHAAAVVLQSAARGKAARNQAAHKMLRAAATKVAQERLISDLARQIALDAVVAAIDAAVAVDPSNVMDDAIDRTPSASEAQVVSSVHTSDPQLNRLPVARRHTGLLHTRVTMIQRTNVRATKVRRKQVSRRMLAVKKARDASLIVVPANEAVTALEVDAMKQAQQLERRRSIRIKPTVTPATVKMASSMRSANGRIRRPTVMCEAEDSTASSWWLVEFGSARGGKHDWTSSSRVWGVSAEEGDHPVWRQQSMEEKLATFLVTEALEQAPEASNAVDFARMAEVVKATAMASAPVSAKEPSALTSAGTQMPRSPRMSVPNEVVSKELTLLQVAAAVAKEAAITAAMEAKVAGERTEAKLAALGTLSDQVVALQERAAAPLVSSAIDPEFLSAAREASSSASEQSAPTELLLGFFEWLAQLCCAPKEATSKWWSD